MCPAASGGDGTGLWWEARPAPLSPCPAICPAVRMGTGS